MPKSFPIIGKEDNSIILNPDELIDLFLNCTADGICIFDMEDRFIRVNQMYTKIFGFTEDDVLGRKYDDFPIPDSLKEIKEDVKLGSPFHNITTQRFHKDGRVLDIAVSYSPFRNSKGEIFAIIAIYRDITDSVFIGKELKRTRELYKLITENTEDMIKVYSKDKKIVYASPSHERALGYTPEQLIGRDVFDIISPDDREHFERVFQKLVETNEPQLFQVKVLTGDKEFIYSESNLSPIYNEQKEIESYVSVGRNITDRVRNDHALRNLDRLSIIGQLAAGVAHEIRNPLTSLKGFSKLLKSTPNKEKQEHYLSIIMNELDRIDIIVNEFMSLAKPQAIQYERESLNLILESTVNILYPQALLHNVQIINHYQANDIDLLCSPHQLKQVFVNFIKNAIEAMPNGGEIHIKVEKVEGNKVLIRIFDEGIGIATDLLRYLGTPFYTTKDKGIGLGLTVSNKIIQEHNGTMKIESQLGQGTTILIELEYI
ncbi:PAS domain S-box protein [Neobacillus sp.]|uniref:PAS domain-containing sensor histidine kinase n=1 Tax=Neobacillus sp. TaxID=2675273 RepID=UPI00289C6687|nr:PAS domain S-box protein [Neobacillus sp.]